MIINGLVAKTLISASISKTINETAKALLAINVGI